jgi:hypothetical protein
VNDESKGPKLPNEPSEPKADSSKLELSDATEPTKTLFGVPLMTFVKGGTTSSAHDRRVAELEFDAQKRRAEADDDRRKMIFEGAKISSQNFASDPSAEKAVVELHYMNSRNEPMYDHGERVRCLADVMFVDGQDQELALIIVCPDCLTRGMPQGQAQLRIRQSNRKWELDTSKAGALIIWDETDPLTGISFKKPYRSAGEVIESERFSCECGWAARIARNKVYPA